MRPVPRLSRLQRLRTQFRPTTPLKQGLVQCGMLGAIVFAAAISLDDSCSDQWTESAGPICQTIQQQRQETLIAASNWIRGIAGDEISQPTPDSKADARSAPVMLAFDDGADKHTVTESQASQLKTVSARTRKPEPLPRARITSVSAASPPKPKSGAKSRLTLETDD